MAVSFAVAIGLVLEQIDALMSSLAAGPSEAKVR